MKKLLKVLERNGKKLIPYQIRTAAKLLRNIEVGYGHYRSARLKQAVDRHGTPVPWFTYPAIEYLAQLDFSACDVFEYGSGNSTLFWDQNAKSVTSIEDDSAWHGMVAGKTSAKVSYHLIQDRLAYIDAIKRFGETYDCILVDGKYRYRCADVAKDYLRPGGMMILDNADWYPNTAGILRAQGLIQVDMHWSCLAKVPVT